MCEALNFGVSLPTHSCNILSSNITRRGFVKRLALLFVVSPFWEACQQAARLIKWQFLGANFSLGHRLLTMDFPPASTERSVKVLVIGGGVTGLSACRRLRQLGEEDFMLLEMDAQLGGNSASGQNEHSAFPLGAHYLPLPNLHDAELLKFLEEAGIIKGYDTQGLPIFDETQMVIAPQERLFINYGWQEGLVPVRGLSTKSITQVRAFQRRMAELSKQKGADGKYLFDIPLTAISTDTSLRYWDDWSMKQWLDHEGFDAPELLTYLDYCCLDDFGLGIREVSAWAAVHYFTARKNPQDNDLTWPEGNARLVAHLSKGISSKTLQQQLAFKVTLTPEGVETSVYDAAQDKVTVWKSEKLLLATPQFINQRLLPDRQIDLSKFHYAPWITATLTLSYVPSSVEVGLSWDNVIHNGKGLGYIHAQHQSLQQMHDKCVITYYRAFGELDVVKARRKVYQTTDAQWQQEILDDLRTAHPEIGELVESISLQRWGHGMISPRPGLLFGQAKKQASQSIEDRIFFAHTDLSGMSLFEEAFHQGIDVADRMFSREEQVR